MARPQPAHTPPAEGLRILRWGSRQLVYRERLAEGVVLTMLRIPAGSFSMGAPEGEEGSSDAERPVHRVTLGEFLMGQTPVTQAQWRAVAEWEREEHEDRELWPADLDPDPLARLSESDRFRDDELPVVNVSWQETMAFCKRLRLRTGKNYTLPSEAQWEYACRAGTTTPFHFGDTISSEVANYKSYVAYGDGPTGRYPNQTTEVASFPANDWGLHDMHGNVGEWCADHWHDTYEGAPEDGRAWVDEKASEGEHRLLRGGSWNRLPRLCRSAFRHNYPPVSRHYSVGLRVCCLPHDLLLYPQTLYP
jgi:formylglycine-generating enzyme required for sulfatase activity